MPAKIIAFQDEARDAIRVGVKTLADAVKVTMGPRGRNVMIEAGYGAPTVTKDGVTVAQTIELQHAWQDVGAQLVKEVASRTSDGAGDGTTTATVLAEAIFTRGLSALQSGVKPVQLKRGIEKAVAATIEKLESFSTPVTGAEQIAHVGAIAANNDHEIGKVLADALERVGKDGVITVDEGQTIDTTIEFVDGMGFDKGFLSPHFVNNRDNLSCELDDPFILLVDGKVSAVRDLVPVLEQTLQQQRALLIVAEDVEGEALALLVVNALRGALKVCAVKAPGFGDSRMGVLLDIGALTGGKVVSKTTGLALDKVGIDDLDSAKRVIVKKDETTLVDGAGSAEDIKSRQAQVTAEAQAHTSDYEKNRLMERVAKLSGGVARVLVGATTEVEMKEKKARVEDALHATRAAAEAGVVPGGGVALLRAREAINALGLEGDEYVGGQIVYQALAAPISQIVTNAGENPAIVIDKVLADSNANFGFNAQTLKYEDLIQTGVIDPTKVSRTAFENAASVASLLLTTDAIVGEAKKLDEDPDADAL